MEKDITGMKENIELQDSDSNSDTNIDFGYIHLKESFNQIEFDAELAEFYTVLVGTIDNPIERTLNDIQRFRTIVTKVYADIERKFIKTLSPGQVWTFNNLHNNYIGVIQRIVNRTIYLTTNDGQVTHASPFQMQERLG